MFKTFNRHTFRRSTIAQTTMARNICKKQLMKKIKTKELLFLEISFLTTKQMISWIINVFSETLSCFSLIETETHLNEASAVCSTLHTWLGEIGSSKVNPEAGDEQPSYVCLTKDPKKDLGLPRRYIRSYSYAAIYAPRKLAYCKSYAWRVVDRTRKNWYR